jgi:hypothetical protein
MGPDDLGGGRLGPIGGPHVPQADNRCRRDIVHPCSAGIATTVDAANTFDSAMPVGDLPGWRQVFAEGFDTPLAAGGWNNSAYYTSKFRAYGPNWADTSKHGRYTADILSVDNGMLTENIYTPAGGMPQVAALVPKRDDTHTSSFQYGRPTKPRVRHNRATTSTTISTSLRSTSIPSSGRRTW